MDINKNTEDIKEILEDKVYEKKYKNLLEFLNDNILEDKNLKPTHVSVSRKKKYYITFNKYSIFWKLYCDHVCNKGKIDLAEYPDDYGCPIIADIDLKRTLNDDEKYSDDIKLYKKYHVEKVVKEYQDLLKSISKKNTSIQFFCVVLEKKSRLENNVIKDGFHIHFPFFTINIDMQKDYILDIIKSKINNIFSDVEINEEEKGKVLDESILGKTWLMYGGSKTFTLDPFLCSKIYDQDLKEITLSKVFDNKKILSEYLDTDGSNLKIILKTLTSNADIEDYSKPLKYYLPIILSIRKKGIINSISTNNIIKADKKEKIKFIIKNENEDINFQDVKTLVDILSEKRANDRNLWMYVGWCLFSLGKGDKKYLDLWINFSAKSSKFRDDKECKEEWTRMYIGNFTIGTLRIYAEEDNTDEYKKWVNTSIENDILKLEKNLNPYDTAKILKKLYGHKYVCISPLNKKIWYEYKNNRWSICDHGITLRNKLSEVLAIKFLDRMDYYSRKKRELCEESDEEDNKENNKELDKKIKILLGISTKLKNTTFKKNVMQECEEIFYDENFLKTLDTNPDILGFPSCVYDSLNEIFRPGTPEDKISLCMGVEYDSNIDKETLKEYEDFLDKVFLNKNLKDYFKLFMSSCIIGMNNDKTFQLWHGKKGNNGKSTLISIIEHAFGSYFSKPPTSLFTKKTRDASSATPELLVLRGTRISVVEEPDEGDKFNVGIIKKLTSGFDSIYIRRFFVDVGEKMKIMNKSVFVCNNKPKVVFDEAFYNRVKPIAFTSKFTSNYPIDEETQYKKRIFKMDSNFYRKVSKLAKALVYCAVKDLPKYKKFGLQDTEEIIFEIEEYKNDCDFLTLFIQEKIDEDEEEFISLDDLYSEFKEWFTRNFPGNKPYSKQDVKKMFKDIWKSPKDGGWYGFKLIFDTKFFKSKD